ncbi:hypothetical protein AcW1_008529 [Taiwanofungus camphoratus]|nr:hypothetical protein AcW1_008529 [Antrodia cinnamomea]
MRLRAVLLDGVKRLSHGQGPRLVTAFRDHIHNDDWPIPYHLSWHENPTELADSKHILPLGGGHWVFFKQLGWLCGLQSRRSPPWSSGCLRFYNRHAMLCSTVYYTQQALIAGMGVACCRSR